MSIYTSQRFSIHIRGIDHPPPHCHVRFNDGSQVCVTLPLVEVMYGATIDWEVREAIIDNLDALVDEWDKLHPIRRRKFKSKK